MENKHYAAVTQQLKTSPKVWLVTGAAGFIGSHLVEKLLLLGQTVIGVDNFSTGSRENLTELEQVLRAELRKNFRFIEGDITDLAVCQQACTQIDYVLHQAAVGSVPYSIIDPLTVHQNNVNGSLNMLLAARDAQVKSFIYASSSSVYGNEPTLPKQESHFNNQCISPYAATKAIIEQYAAVFQHCYQLNTLGLRYFNVYGPRQNPNSQYGAVIPTWITAILKNQAIRIYGDGETTRDFCYIDDVVQANILAACSAASSQHEIYNIGMGRAISLNDLHQHLTDQSAEYADFRQGDIRHSWASIKKARDQLGYQPVISLAKGLSETQAWYRRRLPGCD